jgi:hypothetical protein
MMRNRKKYLFFIGLLSFNHLVSAQAYASFNGVGVYTQDFGKTTDAGFPYAAPATTGGALWNPSGYAEYAGWYTWMDAGDANGGTYYFNGTLDVTASDLTNTGGFYMYTINGGTGLLLGTRPANTTAGGTSNDTCNCDGNASNTSQGKPSIQMGIALGLCLKNPNAVAVNSINIQFDWYQLSTAEDGGQPNHNYFDYKVTTSAAGVPALNLTTYTHVAALDYVGPDIDGTCCTAQTGVLPGTKFKHFNQCVAPAGGIPAGGYIMLRWWDPNDAEDDPHFGIDNIQVTKYSDAACSVVLPVKLLSFDAIYDIQTQSVHLNWSTATEVNNKFFSIEKTKDAQVWETIATVAGAGNSIQTLNYSTVDETPYNGTSYYRLKQTDIDGNFAYSDYAPMTIDPTIKSVLIAPNPAGNSAVITFNSILPGDAAFNIYDLTGRLLATKNITTVKGTNSSEINTSAYANGMYVVTVINSLQQFSAKLIVNHN